LIEDFLVVALQAAILSGNSHDLHFGHFQTCRLPIQVDLQPASTPEGREFRFGVDAKAKTVNHMSIAYAEIDGEPARLLPEGDLKPQITRTVFYTEEPATDQ
jgi:hypothetical protein